VRFGQALTQLQGSLHGRPRVGPGAIRGFGCGHSQHHVAVSEPGASPREAWVQPQSISEMLDRLRSRPPFSGSSGSARAGCGCKRRGAFRQHRSDDECCWHCHDAEGLRSDGSARGGRATNEYLLIGGFILSRGLIARGSSFFLAAASLLHDQRGRRSETKLKRPDLA
jgi:hypothetical protein